jgi:hypothetical protein
MNYRLLEMVEEFAANSIYTGLIVGSQKFVFVLIEA